MKYQYWCCSICKEKFRTSTEMAQFNVEDHIKTHPKEFREHQLAENAYNKAEDRLRKTFRKMYLETWIKNITPPVIRKLWTCPRCKEEMTYHYKFYHQANAQRNGVDYMCKAK